MKNEDFDPQHLFSLYVSFPTRGVFFQIAKGFGWRKNKIKRFLINQFLLYIQKDNEEMTTFMKSYSYNINYGKPYRPFGRPSKNIISIRNLIMKYKIHCLYDTYQLRQASYYNETTDLWMYYSNDLNDLENKVKLIMDDKYSRTQSD